MIKKTLSIIVPCFQINKNHKFLNELLSNLDKQNSSIFQIIELFLINDSPEINIENFINVSRFNLNIRIFNNIINSGQAFSRNYGYEMAKGEFIHFIDQDDLIDLNFYSSIEEIDEIVFTNCILFNSKQSKSHMGFLKKFFLKKFTKISQLSFFLIFDNIILSPGQMIIRNDIFKNIGCFPLLKNYGSDDYGFMYFLAKSNYKYIFHEKALFFHRLHEFQGKNTLNMSKSKIEFFNKYVKEKSLFSMFCKTDLFFISSLKKILYLLFYNRIN